MTDQSDKDKLAGHIEALNSMAGGEDVSPEDQAGDTQVPSEAAAGLGDAVGGSAGPAEGLPELADMAADMEPAASRKARAESLQNQLRRTHAYQFKRTAIPPLIVVGAMLFIVGVLSVVMMLKRGGGQGNFMGGLGWFVAIAALVLSAVLLFGAWLFHYEVSSSDKSKKN